MSPIHRILAASSYLIRVLGHLALWPTLYTVGVLVLMDWAYADAVSGYAAMLFVGLCAHACYLLDRVKLSDSNLDPADEQAQPQRFRFLAGHARVLRVLILSEIILAALIAPLVSSVLIWIPIAAAVGVLLYAGRLPDPDRPRFKDRSGFKAVFIASGHIALALATCMCEHAIWDQFLHLLSWIPAIAIGALVFGDAILCDIEDHDADQAFATRSIPVLFGVSQAWWIAFAAHAAGLAILGFTHGSVEGTRWGFWVFGGALLITDCAVWMLSRRRDPVDARLLPIAIMLVLLSSR